MTSDYLSPCPCRLTLSELTKLKTPSKILNFIVPNLYSLRLTKDDSLSFLVCLNQDNPLLKLKTHLSLLYFLSPTFLSLLYTQNKNA